MLQPERLFAFWLALNHPAGTLDPDALLRAMPVSLLNEWRGAALAMGIGPELDDIRHAELCHAAGGFRVPMALYRRQPAAIRPVITKRPMTRAEVARALAGWKG